jgi:transposase-like protein
MWFMAMWYVTSQKNGVSALGLQRVLGLGSYETAWTWLHKLRRAMVRPGRDGLCGTVEVDETYVGGLEKGKRGRETGTKAIVAVAAEENGKGIGRIRLHRVKDLSGASLLPFIQSAVAPGAVIHTDGWSGYSGLTAAGYKHESTVISSSPDPAHIVMPRVHNVAALLKRWLLGTHQGAVEHAHLDYYLDEFAFRFNRRRSNARGLLFHRRSTGRRRRAGNVQHDRRQQPFQPDGVSAGVKGIAYLADTHQVARGDAGGCSRIGDAGR